MIQRLSLTGGSAILAKGAFPDGTQAKMDLNSVFGKVTASIEFLQTGADGLPLAQAFRFLDMDGVSSRRFAAAIDQMQSAGFSDVEREKSFNDVTSQILSKLWNSFHRPSR